MINNLFFVACFPHFSCRRSHDTAYLYFICSLYLFQIQVQFPAESSICAGAPSLTTQLKKHNPESHEAWSAGVPFLCPWVLQDPAMVLIFPVNGIEKSKLYLLFTRHIAVRFFHNGNVKPNVCFFIISDNTFPIGLFNKICYSFKKIKSLVISS